MRVVPPTPLLTSVVIALATLAVPLRTARAADPDASAGLRGFELMLRPSFGSTPPDSPVRRVGVGNAPIDADPGSLLAGASPWGRGFGGQVTFGYRPRPFIGAGLRGGFRMATGTNPLDGSTNLSRIGWDVGFYARVYPLAVARGISRYLDPWVGMGVGYQHDTQSFRKTLTIADSANVLGDVAIDHHALSVPLGLGIDVRIVKFLSVGPSFELVVATPIAGCVSTHAPGTTTPTYCSSSDPGKEFLAAATYLAWNAGLDVKLTF